MTVSSAPPSDDRRRGYVEGVVYPPQDHPDLDPVRHAAALLSAGRAAPELGGRWRYLEVGCGSGFTLAAMAAAHPQAEFVGVDLDQAHVDAVRSLTAEAGLANLTAHARDIACPARLGAEPFDTIAAHGVWSWVDDAVRAGIVSLADGLLRDGGVFQVSYNCLPGMAALEPIRTLLRAAIPADQTTPERVKAGLSFLHGVVEAGSPLLDDPRLAGRIEEVLAAPPSYVAHEYFNEHWRSFHHAEVVDALRPASLTFACSCRVADGLDRARLSEQQRALLARAADEMARETLRDVFTGRTLRSDLYLKRPSAASRQSIDRLIAETRFVCILSEDGMPADAPPSYRRVLDRLSEGAATHRDLLAVVDTPTPRERGSLHPVVLHLLAMEAIGVALPAARLERRRESVARFNEAVLRLTRSGVPLPGLLSPVTGRVVALSPEKLRAIADQDARWTSRHSGTMRLLGRLGVEL